MNLTEYLPHTFLYSNSWAALYYRQTNQINSNSPVIVYVSKGDIITLKGTICRNMWLIWLWVTLWRLKTNRRQPQVGHLFFNLHVNQDTVTLPLHSFDSTSHLSHRLTHPQARTHTHAPLTRPSLGSWCWVSWWSPATLEEDREGGRAEGRNGKRPLVFDDIFVFSSDYSPVIPSSL